MVVEVGEVVFWINLSRRRRASVGAEVLVGAEGVATSDCRPEGTARVNGELWGAVCPGGVSAGEEIVVENVTGLTLQVRRK
jgi:membrane-bound ClpP family serine protease